MRTLADTLERRGDLSGAIAQLERANKRPKLDERDYNYIQYMIAGILSRHGRYDEAEPHIKRWAAGRLKEVDDSPDLASEPYTVLGAFYEEAGKSDLAKQNYMKALAVPEKRCGPETALASCQRLSLGLFCYSSHDYTAAEKYFRRALLSYKQD